MFLQNPITAALSTDTVDLDDKRLLWMLEHVPVKRVLVQPLSSPAMGSDQGVIASASKPGALASMSQDATSTTAPFDFPSWHAAHVCVDTQDAPPASTEAYVLLCDWVGSLLMSTAFIEVRVK